MSVDTNIPTGWEKTILGKVAKTNLNSIDKNYSYEDISYLDTGSITKGKIEKFQNFKLTTAPSRAKRLVKNNDIIYSTVRPNHEHYGFMSNPLKNLVVSTGFTVITSISIHSKFLYYFLTQSSITNYLQILAEHSTTAYPSIKPIDIERLEFNTPKNVEEQKAIAKILSTFDDKIELLDFQNKTLETITQTVFKEWFGKYQIGDELPELWSFEKLEVIANHIKNSIKPFKNPNNDYLHYSLPAYDDELKPLLEKGITIKSNKYEVVANSFLVSKLNPFTPRIWTIFDSDTNHICSTEFQVVKPKNADYFTLIHCFLNSKQFTSELSQNIKGTSSSHQRVNPQDIFDINLIIPKEDDLIKFNSLINPLILKKDINHQQIQFLKKTRDTLLPKLMSGQLRVNDFKE
jgi:type I restriction enzyme S subunit